MFGGQGFGPGFGQGAAPPGGGGTGQNPFMGFQGMFGPGGLGGIQIDPGFMDQIFADGGMAFMQQAGVQQAQQQQQEAAGQKPAFVPTAASALRRLPKIKVTQYDIECNESTECSICLDELVVGQTALRIPCGHLYHEDCVEDWLRKSNECPVCRYELPTDDAAYEKERCKRMEGRKIRLKHADLTQKSAAELRRLAEHIAVDVTGCLEKAEFVERIANSSKVQIIPCGGEESEPTSPAAPAGLLIYTQAQLDAMSVTEAQALADRCGVDRRDLGDGDKKELIKRLLSSGRLVLGASCSGQEAPAGAGATTPSSSDARCAASGMSDVPLAEQSVKMLRQLAQRMGVSLTGCLEKAEMVERIQSAGTTV